MARIRRMSKGARIINSEDLDIDNPDLVNADEMPVEDIIESEDADMDLTAETNKLDEVEDEVQNIEDGIQSVEEQIEENEAAISDAENGGEPVTADEAALSTEALVSILNDFDIDTNYRTSFNSEDYTNNPISVLKANNEALGDIWTKMKEMASKAWEAIKSMFRKIIDFFKKALPSRYNKLVKLIKILKELDGSSVHEDMVEEFKEKSSDKFGGLSLIAGGAKDNIDSASLKTLEESLINTMDRFNNLGDKFKFEGATMTSTEVDALFETKQSAYKPENTHLSLETNETVSGNINILGASIAGDSVKFILGAKVTNSKLENQKGEYYFINTYSDYKVTTFDGVKELDKSTAISLCEDRKEKCKKIESVNKNLQNKVDKAVSNISKAIDKIETKKNDKEDVVAKDSKKALERSVKGLQNYATAAVLAYSSITKACYDYTVLYASYTIKGIKKKNNEKEDNKK